MPANNVSTYLTYADLQMAAEAIFEATFTPGLIPIRELTDGNNRSSTFTAKQAAQFIEDWRVIDHERNTSTGFSGTLFECLRTDPARGLVQGQLVMCFRSTEFADDAARDNQATNVMEIKEFGWAFGQIADMQAWYTRLTSTDRIPAGAPIDVTGYSLGGHLATAFNLLYPGAARSTYTFNGAGVGEIIGGTLSQTVSQFQSLRSADQQSLFTTAVARDFYGRWRAELNSNADTTRRGQALGELTSLQITLSANPTANAAALKELDLLSQAVGRGSRIRIEADRINAGVSSGDASAPARPVASATALIAGIGLDYQLAVLRASANTRAFSSGILDGLGLAIAADRAPLTLPGASPIYDLYGAPLPSAVSNSQHHYGTPVRVFIEDQPLTRGNFIGTTALGSLRFGEVKLLNSGFASNDFGDTHSLVLIVDSLNVQNALVRLDANVDQSTLDTVLRNASNTRGSSTFFTQGQAEFDTLERMVQALGDIAGASSNAAWIRMNPNPAGGTWAVRENEGSYTGRDAFHANLGLITTNNTAFTGLAGQVRVVATHDAQAAHDDFAALLSLTAGASFSLRLNDPAPTSPGSLALYAGRRDMYDQWLADRIAISEGRVRDSLNFTDSYLSDRTTLLNALARRNTSDSSGSLITDARIAADRVVDLSYSDALTAQTLTLSVMNAAAPVGTPTTGPRQLVAFGNDQANTLTGTAETTFGDHLYAGAGNDTVMGLTGADWLEGNTGDDSLDGGQGNDTLLGGAGSDRYTFSTGWGFDSIQDSDGFGTITVAGIGAIDGSNTVKVGEGVWQTPDARVNYTQVAVTGGHDLYVSFSDRTDVIVIRNWSNDQRKVGITLPAALTQPVVYALSEESNTITQVAPTDGTPLAFNQAYVPEGTLVIDGLGGNDQIAGGNNALAPLDQRLDGGAGNDMVFGGTGNDIVIGGLGNDLLAGNAGNDVVYGGDGDDVVASRRYGAGVNQPVAGEQLAGAQLWAEFGQFWQWRYESGTPAQRVAYNQSLSPNPLDAPWTTDLPAAGYALGIGYDSVGDDGNDTVFGGAGNDNIATGSGADVISGDGGHDVIFGNSGHDVIAGGDDVDELVGGAGDDEVSGDAGNDYVFGDLGADTLRGGADDDWLWGDLPATANGLLPPGTDVAAMGADMLDGGDGNDTMFGGAGADTLQGGAGNDKLSGDDAGTPEASEGADWLDGGNGDDSLWGNGGNDVLDGGSGADILDAGTGDDILFGSDGNDQLAGKDGADALFGGNGSDNLYGDAGNDALDGGAGRDYLYGLAGNDTLHSDGLDYLNGGEGNDTYIINAAGINAATLELAVSLVDDTSGTNTIQIVGASAGQLSAVTVGGQLFLYTPGGSMVALDKNLSLTDTLVIGDDGAADPVTVEQIVMRNTRSLIPSVEIGPGGVLQTTAVATSARRIDGSAYADLIEGGYGADRLDGAAGDDSLSGNAGQDVLQGGIGSDTLVGGLGDDVLAGGSTTQTDTGTDTYVFAVGDGNDSVDLGDAAAAAPGGGVFQFGAGITRDSIRVHNLGGHSAQDRLLVIEYSQTDSITLERPGSDARLQELRFADGSTLSHADLLALVPPPDTSGDDLVTGAGGADRLDGGPGQDRIDGGAGNDTLIGGAGSDTLTGGEGQNHYVFELGSGSDEIRPTDGESATLVFTGAGRTQLSALLQGADLLLIQQGGGSIRITDYGNRPDVAAWSVQWADGSTSNLGQLATSAPIEATAQAQRRADFLAQQYIELAAPRVVGGDQLVTPQVARVEQGVDVATAAAAYGHYSSESYVNVTQNGYAREPIYQNIPTTTLTYFPFPNGGVPSSGGSDYPANGPGPGLFITTVTTDWRLVGWNTVPREITISDWSAGALQSVVTGTAGDDTVSANASSRLDGPALFRGRVETGDGNDVVRLNSNAAYWYDDKTPRLGAWIDLGAGNDQVTGSDMRDIIIGGAGSDTMDGQEQADTYLISDDGAGIDRIADFLLDDGNPFEMPGFDWGDGVDKSQWSQDQFLFMDYAGPMGTDRVEFDAKVQHSQLSYRWVAGSTLELLQHGRSFLQVDYRTESLGAHLSGSATGPMPGIEEFVFSDGSTFTVTQLVASIPQAPPAGEPNRAPVAVADSVTVAEDATASVSGNVLANDSDPDAGQILALLDPGTLAGQFGTLQLAADGSYRYLLDNALAAVQSLAAGQSFIDRFTHTVSDSAAPALTATSSLQIVIAGANDAPTLTATLADADATVLRPIDVRLPQDAFADVDQGDVLTVTARQTDGQALPAWLTFDAAASRFTGQAPRSMRGMRIDIELTAIDRYGASVGATFELRFNATGATLLGADGNDSLVGSDLDDRLLGQGGDDLLDGAAGDDTLDGGVGSDSLRGGVGDDTYIVDAPADVITERANEGADTVRSSIRWALGGNVENLTLTGADAINGTGNSLANVLIGNAANNTLNGGAGADTMQGGAGDDSYTVDNSADLIVEAAGEGMDRVNASVTTTLWADVENLTLTGTAAINGTGNALGNAISGNSAGNLLSGGDGDDTLNGAAGADSMSGGTGNDSYVVDSALDVVSESVDEGLDTVLSSANHTLGSHVENLTLTGSTATLGTGNALDNVLAGNGIGNTLDAGDGDDTLAGGAGADTMIGGRGNDLFMVNAASDVVTERASEGIDTIHSSATLTLASNVENLTLTATGNLNGTGNALANQITGNSGNNTLDGGAGADNLRGSAGNDTYVIDDGGDVVVELANEGTDLIRTAVTTALSAHIENLTLTGTAAINGTGNELDNVLAGNSANNLLMGGAGNDTLNGGAGADTMNGGQGNDTYLVNTAADVVTEAAGDGIDAVQSSVTLTLGNQVENLLLTGAVNLNGTGNALDNVLTGNAGNNVLAGAAGNDTYAGGAGNDTLNDTSTSSHDVYRWGPGQGNDTITDAGGNDRIELSPGVTAAQVSLVRNGNNLRVTIGGSADTLTVVNWYASADNRIETVALFDGTLINAGTTAPLSVVALPGAREALRMQRVPAPLEAARAMAGATSLDSDRYAQVLVQAMAQFGGRPAQTDLVQHVRAPDSRRIDLASPL